MVTAPTHHHSPIYRKFYGALKPKVLNIGKFPLGRSAPHNGLFIHYKLPLVYHHMEFVYCNLSWSLSNVEMHQCTSLGSYELLNGKRIYKYGFPKAVFVHP